MPFENLINTMNSLKKLKTLPYTLKMLHSHSGNSWIPIRLSINVLGLQISASISTMKSWL